MKKLIVILFIFIVSSPLYAQSFDSTNFALAIGDGGYYNQLINRTVLDGQAIGTVSLELTTPFSSVDTSLFSYVIGEGGYLKYVVNRDTYYGKAPGTVAFKLIYDINTISLSENNNFTGTQTFANISVTRLSTSDSSTVTSLAVLPAATSIGTVSSTEIGYLDNVTSAIQTQFTGKASLSGATFTGDVLFKSDSDWVDAASTDAASITGTGQKGILYVANITVGATSPFTLTFNNAVITATSSVIITLRTASGFTSTLPPSIYTVNKQDGQIQIILFNNDSGGINDSFIIDYLILP